MHKKGLMSNEWHNKDWSVAKMRARKGIYNITVLQALGIGIKTQSSRNNEGI